ncbi:MAG: hypothetical protein KAV87_32090 [Desulfobacteraceae bacterium]|nr:hypothetical protein [Desulfobacteraceae bacterium]
MRIIRKLSFLGILSIGIAVLFLVGMSFMQAQVTTRGKPEKPPGKPDKPGEEEVTWAVQIPEGSVNLKGTTSEYEYANNGNDIIVSVEKKGWKTVGKGGASGIYYILLFKLVNPTEESVEFSDVSLTGADEYPENGDPCVFPGICGSTVPDCLHCFLNQQHPYSSDSENYDHVYIKFWIWGYDIEGMERGDIYKLGYELNPYSGNDRIRIKTGYTPVNTCSRSEPAYHDIICQQYAQDGQLNTWIKKISENRWSIYVGYDVDLLSPFPVTLPVCETYCIEEKLKGWVSRTVTTLEATGAFSFQMDWIKKSE